MTSTRSARRFLPLDMFRVVASTPSWPAARCTWTIPMATRSNSSAALGRIKEACDICRYRQSQLLVSKSGTLYDEHVCAMAASSTMRDLWPVHGQIWTIPDCTRDRHWHGRDVALVRGLLCRRHA